MADEAKLIAIVEANTKQMENALKRLEGLTKQSTDRMTASVKKLDQQVGVLGQGMARIGKAVTWTAVIGTAKQLAGTFAEVAKRAGDLADAADKIGISTKSLQELRYAAKQSGVDIDQLDGALSKLSKGLAEARTGSGDLRKLLLANGMTEAQVQALSFEQALNKVADLVKNAKDATDAAKISTLAFGKANDELVNLLRDGAAGLDAFRAKANETGQILGEEGVRQLAAYDDKLQELTGRWDVAVDHMTLYALTALEKIGEVEHQVVDSITAAAAAVAAAMPKSAEEQARAAGAAAGAAIAAGTPASRIKNVPPAIEPTGTARAVEEYIRRQREGPAKTTVIPPAGGGGGAGRTRATGSGMTTISTRGGLKATVATAYADQFQGLLDDLEAQGYIISSLGGYNKRNIARTNRPSMHSFGRAIDINPLLNPVTRAGQPMITNLPPDIQALAMRWGLGWGGAWRSKKDPMHFEATGAPMGEEALNTAKGLSNEWQKVAENTEEANQRALDYADASLQAKDAITNANAAFSRDLVGGLIRDLEHGVKPAEAFANALQKIADRLLDIALNQIFPDVGGALVGGLAGGGGLLGGKIIPGFLAQGGVMTGRGQMPLRRYASGGVANSPQMAVFGEGSRPEAYVPLPDGRAIPVRMRDVPSGKQRVDVAVHPSPLFVVTTQTVAEQAGHRAVAAAGDNARRRAGGR